MSSQELLLEIGCEEIPAAWLPLIQGQLKTAFDAALDEVRLAHGPSRAYVTPRRLVVHVPDVADSQEAEDEPVIGPSVAAAFDKAGRPTKAALGFAQKRGVAVEALQQIETPKGKYLAYQKRVPGKAAIEVLPLALYAILRAIAFGKRLRWDARLDNGRGELPFCRPIRWLLYLYGGQVVPCTIERMVTAAGVGPVQAGRATYGHRLSAPVGASGSALEVRSFSEYRETLERHHVLLEAEQRQELVERRVRELRQRLGGGPARDEDSGMATLLANSVEWPAAIVGTFPEEFLSLPTEVLAMTMVHHQHYFPVADARGVGLLPAFVAVIDTPACQTDAIVRGNERVLVARLRDAKFFWDEDRKRGLDERTPDLERIEFHRKLGSYAAKTRRITALASALAARFGGPTAARLAEQAAHLAKTDLSTQMVGEFAELQGIMAGLYARAEGQPEAVWRALYWHYHPLAPEAAAPPRRADLGEHPEVWAALSIADKLDTLVGMFFWSLESGQITTGSRDPYGLRRQAQGLVRVIVDSPELVGQEWDADLGALMHEGLPGWRATFVRVARREHLDTLGAKYESDKSAKEKAGEYQLPVVEDLAGGKFDENQSSVLADLEDFLEERVRFVLKLRGFRQDEVEAVAVMPWARALLRPLDARRRLEALRALRGSADLEALAVAFKRLKNILKPLDRQPEANDSLLTQPSEQMLLDQHRQRSPLINDLAAQGKYEEALRETAAFRPAVDRLFTDIFVMVDDEALRNARLHLLWELRDQFGKVADISELTTGS